MLVPRGDRAPPNRRQCRSACAPSLACLHSERVHHVLQDKSGPAHRVSVQLVVCGTHVVHVENSLRRQAIFGDSQAATVKQSKIKIEKTIGKIKAYLRDTIVTAEKQRTSAHAVPRISRQSLIFKTPASCHVKTAVNTRKTKKSSPKPTNKSQYVPCLILRCRSEWTSSN